MVLTYGIPEIARKNLKIYVVASIVFIFKTPVLLKRTSSNQEALAPRDNVFPHDNQGGYVMRTSLTLVVLFMVHSASAGQVGDMNGDGVIGLEEALISLQIVSGISPPFGCTPGQKFCLDTTISVQCNRSGTSYSFVENCSAIPSYGCNPNSGECYACIPNEKYCIDADYEGTCNSVGTGNSAFRNCTAIYGYGCLEATGQCNACVPNQKYCIDANYEGTCNSVGTGNSAFRNCTAIYGYGCLEATGQCNACVPNQKYCIDADFEGTCNSVGTGNSAFRNCTAIYGTGCDPATGQCIVNN